MNRSLFLMIALIGLLLVGCSGSGSEGTWVTDKNTRFGRWLQIHGDGTYSRDDYTGDVSSVDGSNCLLSQSENVCNPFTVSGDTLELDFFGEPISFWRVDSDALSRAQPDHQMVGRWQFPGSLLYTDFLPNGDLVETGQSASSPSKWSADDDTLCIVVSTVPLTSDDFSEDRFLKTWKVGDCRRVTFSDEYATLGAGTNRETVLRRVNE